MDMTRMTLQRAKVWFALIYCSIFFIGWNSFLWVKWCFPFCFSFSYKDAQDLGISIELLPLSRPDEEFIVSKFYAVWLYLYFLFLDYLQSLIQSLNSANWTQYVSGIDWTRRRWSCSIYPLGSREVWVSISLLFCSFIVVFFVKMHWLLHILLEVGINDHPRSWLPCKIKERKKEIAYFMVLLAYDIFIFEEMGSSNNFEINRNCLYKESAHISNRKQKS